MTIHAKPAILIVDDERIVAWDERELVNEFGYDCYAIASSAEQALSAAAKRCPDLVLMDIRLQGATDGIEAARLLQERYGRRVRVIFMSAHAKADMGPRADTVHAIAWLRKPIQPALLQQALAQAFEKPDSEHA
jgi:CheY-like chemotaxis protein